MAMMMNLSRTGVSGGTLIVMVVALMTMMSLFLLNASSAAASVLRNAEQHQVSAKACPCTGEELCVMVSQLKMEKVITDDQQSTPGDGGECVSTAKLGEMFSKLKEKAEGECPFQFYCPKKLDSINKIENSDLKTYVKSLCESSSSDGKMDMCRMAGKSQ